jgi:RNA polymerase sigma factor for flagellar operon FliA
MRQPTRPSSSDLVLLGEVIRGVVRRGRLSPADAEDFSQGVQLKFLESGYDAFARFDGRSSLRTYLTTVVWRLLLDGRTAAYGKWRPSAAARRLGPEALRLDRLINRDRLTVDEAIQMASRAPDASPDRVLRLIADRLPRRRRTVVVADDVLQLVAREFPDPIEARERAAKIRQTRRALGQAFNQLNPKERELMSLRFRQSLTVQEIAGRLNVDAKRLYRTFARLVGKLRRDMGASGVTDLTFPC